PQQVRASGGGIKSPLWRQILADVLECEIATTETAEGAAYGAGLLALVGSGRFSSVEEACAATVRVRSGPEPGPGVAAYREAHARYRLLYPALRSVHGPGRASELSAG
ncbi:MAG TPA: FGGY-family carbohydrate kinase, partial [Acidimicrobiia bacterium]|nr:FGGY-family carbohydrate kinase [Acidimicrobiia bacterium]